MSKRPRILALASRFPYPLVGGDRLRVYHFLRLLSRSYDVDLLSLHERLPAQADLDHLESFIRQVHCFPVSTFRSVGSAALNSVFRGLPLQVGYYYHSEVQRWTEDNIHQYDLIFCFHVRMAQYVMMADCRKIADLVDAISMNYSAALRSTPEWKWRVVYKIELSRLLAYERKVITNFDNSILISQVDRDFLVSHGALGQKVSVIPNGTDLAHLPLLPGDHEDIDILFLGNMKTQPNQSAAIFLVDQVLPILQSTGKGLKVYIVGTSPPGKITDLGSHEGVVVTGEVRDVPSFIQRAKVVVAPMLFGAGVQNKILEAMALAKPVVATSLGGEGIEGVHGVHYLIADGAPAFSAAITSLLEDQQLRESIGNAARQLIRKKYTWEVVEMTLREEIDRCMSR